MTGSEGLRMTTSEELGKIEGVAKQSLLVPNRGDVSILTTYVAAACIVTK
jgi:hypothetical protein